MAAVSELARPRHLIAGMWGTTNLSLFLCVEREDGVPAIERRVSGPGVSAMSAGRWEDTFFSLADPWLRESPDAPVYLAGMVGSTIGWNDAGYAECPIKLKSPHRPFVFSARGRSIHIIPGLQCRRMDEQDIMRGEETELFGWALSDPASAQGRHLVCLPGTHSKWVLVEDGAIREFVTGVTGELFAALRSATILVPADTRFPDLVDDTFLAAARDMMAPGSALIHKLFSLRVHGVLNDESGDVASQRLSGMLIGADVSAALERYESRTLDSCVIIGARAVAERYRAALGLQGVNAQILGAVDMSAVGLWSYAFGGIQNED